MKPIQFNVPVPKNHTLLIQEDILERFYPFMHRHIEHQIIWIKSGEGHLLVEDNVHPFRDNDIFLIGSDQSHVFKAKNETTQVHTISLFFNLTGTLSGLFILPEMQSIVDFVNRCSNGFKIPTALAPKVHLSLEIIHQAEAIDRLIRFIELLQTLSQYKKKLEPLSGVVGKVTIDAPNRILEICQYIDRHFQEHLTLEVVSAHSNLTPQAFCRFFKKSTGKTFVNYLNEVRIRHACRLLTSRKVEQIGMVAIQSGFSSVTNFNRVFLKFVGLSPSGYMDQYRTILEQ